MNPKHKQAIELYRQGKSLHECAAAIGVHFTFVYKLLKQRDIPRRRRGRPILHYDDIVKDLAASLTTSQIAGKHGVCNSTVNKTRRRYLNSLAPD